MNIEEFRAEATRRAQEETRKRGLKVGDFVGHPSTMVNFTLQNIEGDVATVALDATISPGGIALVVQFPLNELFLAALIAPAINLMMAEIIQSDSYPPMIVAFKNL